MPHRQSVARRFPRPSTTSWVIIRPSQGV